MTDYQSCLDAIFESFLGSRPARLGRHDRDIRDPRAILDIAARHDLLSPPERTVKITGSKGKGTTARLAASWLGAQGVGPVGLFISPNEIDQADRIRIDGEPIGHADFVRLYRRFEPELADLGKAFGPARYLSPFGIFLLIALAWFKEREIRYFVLEAGRGAAFDEVGRLPAHLAVVTSLFTDHADQIGPTLGDIARNKMAIAEGTRRTILGPDVPGILRDNGIAEPPDAKIVAPPPATGELPRWVALDLAIARMAGRTLIGWNGDSERRSDCPVVTGSFGRLSWRSVPLTYDGSIRFQDFDRDGFEAFVRHHPSTLVVHSWSDQKDGAPFLAWFREKGVATRAVALSNLDMHTYRSSGDEAATVDFTDSTALGAVFDAFVDELRPDGIYALGIQPFLRLLKQAAGRL
ncbi:hypothetical protein [Inquilinus sp. CAU 1745]|uniref:hypothetical protein n=1 Tax=Inquilinus sp. CAU 1745 TaxID=3140369 RepID=UPI00325A75C0